MSPNKVLTQSVEPRKYVPNTVLGSQGGISSAGPETPTIQEGGDDEAAASSFSFGARPAFSTAKIGPDADAAAGPGGVSPDPTRPKKSGGSEGGRKRDQAPRRVREPSKKRISTQVGLGFFYG